LQAATENITAKIQQENEKLCEKLKQNLHNEVQKLSSDICTLRNDIEHKFQEVTRTIGGVSDALNKRIDAPVVAARTTTDRISQEINARSGGLLDEMKEYRAETENSLKEFRQDYSLFREQMISEEATSQNKAGGEMNKLVNHYFTQVIKPKCILFNNGMQFQSSSSWRKNLAEQNVQVRFTPIRHPQANPSERCMREIFKFCKIYCSQNHRKWAKLLPKIEEWLTTRVAGSIGFTLVKLRFEAKKPDLFEEILMKLPENIPESETIGDKVMKAYTRMRKKAGNRRKRRKTGNKTWELKVNDKVPCKGTTSFRCSGGCNG